MTNVDDSIKCPQCDGCGRIANSDDGEPWRFDNHGRDYILNADGLPLADGWKARAITCVNAMQGVENPAAVVANAHAQAAEIARLSKVLEESAKSAIEAEAAACDKTPAATREELAKIVLKELESHRGWSEPKYDIVDALLARLRQPGPPFRLVDWPPPHFDADGMVRVNHQWHAKAVELMAERHSPTFAPMRTLDHDQYILPDATFVKSCLTGVYEYGDIDSIKPSPTPFVSYNLRDLRNGSATFQVTAQRNRTFERFKASNGYFVGVSLSPVFSEYSKTVWLRGKEADKDDHVNTFPIEHISSIRLALNEFNAHMAKENK